MTRTGRTLTEYMDMGAAGIAALISFINYITPEWKVYQEMHPKDEYGEWFSQMKANAILADIYDVFVAANTKKGRKAQTYPRPKSRRTIGRDAIPIKDFWTWWRGGE